MKENLILDGHKLAWLNGERVVPITIGWALTRK